MNRLFLSRRARNAAYCLTGLVLLSLVSLLVGRATGTEFLAHSPYDTYTIQAMLWRSGQVSMPEGISWLELAVYNGRYYVSFPPSPTVPMLLLSFVFGAQTPSVLVTLLYFLAGYAVAFFLFRRYTGPARSLAFALLLSLAGSLLDLAVSGTGIGGGVWFQAQLFAYALTLLAFYLVDGERRAGWAWGLVCIALAVGARPINAVFAPVLLALLYPKIKKETIGKTVLACLPYIAAPALIAAAYGSYNFARFGNPLEFGHSYLPEYTEAGTKLFSLANLPRNIANILRPPKLFEGSLKFPSSTGFAVYLTNPLLLYALFGVAVQVIRRRADWRDALVAAAMLLQAAMLLTHLTNGGWQYGTRYLCDALPAAAYLCARGGRRPGPVTWLGFGALAAFNVYATIAFHFL